MARGRVPVHTIFSSWSRESNRADLENGNIVWTTVRKRPEFVSRRFPQSAHRSVVSAPDIEVQLLSPPGPASAGQIRSMSTICWPRRFASFHASRHLSYFRTTLKITPLLSPDFYQKKHGSKIWLKILESILCQKHFHLFSRLDELTNPEKKKICKKHNFFLPRLVAVLGDRQCHNFKFRPEALQKSFQASFPPPPWMHSWYLIKSKSENCGTGDRQEARRNARK